MSVFINPTNHVPSRFNKLTHQAIWADVHEKGLFIGTEQANVSPDISKLKQYASPQAHYPYRKKTTPP